MVIRVVTDFCHIYFAIYFLCWSKKLGQLCFQGKIAIIERFYFYLNYDSQETIFRKKTTFFGVFFNRQKVFFSEHYLKERISAVNLVSICRLQWISGGKGKRQIRKEIVSVRLKTTMKLEDGVKSVISHVLFGVKDIIKKLRGSKFWTLFPLKKHVLLKISQRGSEFSKLTKPPDSPALAHLCPRRPRDRLHCSSESIASSVYPKTRRSIPKSSSQAPR